LGKGWEPHFLTQFAHLSLETETIVFSMLNLCFAPQIQRGVPLTLCAIQIHLLTYLQVRLPASTIAKYP